MVRRLSAWILAAAGIVGCEDENLFVQVPDAAAPDAEVIDIPDAGFPDASEPPPAPEPIYVHTGSILYSYDPMQNLTTAIGAFRSDEGPVTNMVDIAIDLRGHLFGGTLDKKVVRIDPVTARVTPAFDFDDILHGLTFLSDGRLVVAGERVSIVDPENGHVISQLVDGSGFVTSGDVVGLPDGNLYWTVKGAQSGDPDDVVRIKPATGEAEVIGSAGIDKIFGLGFAKDELFGFSSGGRVVVIDPVSGASKEILRLDGSWWGATTNPVLWDSP